MAEKLSPSLHLVDTTADDTRATPETYTTTAGRLRPATSTLRMDCVTRLKKNEDAVAPWPPMEDAAAFNVDDLLNEANDLLRS